MTGWQGYTGGGWSSCQHVGPNPVMKLGKAIIHGASRSEAEGHYGWTAMVSCLGNTVSAPSAPVLGNSRAKTLFSPELFHYEPPALLTIDWPDGSVPPMEKAWWKRLYDDLAKMEGNVVVFCAGGHGRTGTALSILAGLGGLKKHGCPVLYVRKHHCTHAVETSSQIAYVEAMTGLPVKAEAYYTIKAREDAKKAAANPTQGVTQQTTTGGGQSGAGTIADRLDLVWDPESNSLVPAGKEQDWEGSWHRRPV